MKDSANGGEGVSLMRTNRGWSGFMVRLAEPKEEQRDPINARPLPYRNVEGKKANRHTTSTLKSKQIISKHFHNYPQSNCKAVIVVWDNDAV